MIKFCRNICTRYLNLNNQLNYQYLLIYLICQSEIYYFIYLFLYPFAKVITYLNLFI